LHVERQYFARLPGEDEDALRARAFQSVGWETSHEQLRATPGAAGDSGYRDLRKGMRGLPPRRVQLRERAEIPLHP